MVTLQRAAYRVEAELIGYDRMPPLREEAAEVVARELTVLGVKNGPGLIGLLGYTRVDDVVEIDRVAVDPTRFGRGIGRRLLVSLHARERSARLFRVSTGAANLPAIALYESMGYTFTREEESEIRLAHFERTQPQ